MSRSSWRILLGGLAALPSLRAQLYLNESPGRMVDGTAIETFRLEENDPRGLGLFAPLPEPDYPDTFRFDIETFKNLQSPFAAFLQGAPEVPVTNPSGQIRGLFDSAIPDEDWTRMLERAERLLEKHPDDVKNIRGLATLYAMTGNYERAARNFARYLAKKPGDLAFTAGFAQTLFSLARFDACESATRRALEIQPNFLPALYTQTCLKVATNGPLEKLTHFWAGATIQQKEQLAGWLHADRVPLRQVLGESGYTRLCDLALGPGSAANLLLIPDSLGQARSAFSRQSWGRALVYYELAVGYGVDGIAIHQQLARCLFEAGRAPEALRRMAALAARFPSAAEVWYNMGYIFINTGAAAEAVKAFGEAVRLAPAVGEYHFALACAYALDGQLDETFQLLPGLRGQYPQRFPDWMEGDAPYLRIIRSDPRYPKLTQPIAAPRPGRT
jgi:tetratricopeptide (TPR) repeat protein